MDPSLGDSKILEGNKEKKYLFLKTLRVATIRGQKGINWNNRARCAFVGNREHLLGLRCLSIRWL